MQASRLSACRQTRATANQRLLRAVESLRRVAHIPRLDVQDAGMPHTIEAEVLFSPPTSQLRYLPEGPYPLAGGQMSWVAIQHGPESQRGSLNVYDFASGENRCYDLPGRPGFAFPTSRPGTFLVGVERRLVLFQPLSGDSTDLTDELETKVDGTIINDAVCFAHGVVFGCKDLDFRSPKAGLYFWRSADERLFQLRDDQICSNGKVILNDHRGHTLLDIDTPTRQVRRYRLDAAAGTLSEAEVALDLHSAAGFPDGMIATPDGLGVIISFYNPDDIDAGETRQYRLSDGVLERVWRTPGSPRNTCPQLVRADGEIKLVITTAVEHMSQEQQLKHRHAGCLFVGATPFDSLPDTPACQLSSPAE